MTTARARQGRRRRQPRSEGVTRVILGRATRAFVDGLVSILLVAWLQELGFSPFEIGVVVTATLVGSALLTLGVGLRAHRWTSRTILVGAALVMTGTGIGFATATSFWPVLVVAAVGTLNPTAGDVSVFLPTEQAYLAGRVDDARRPQLFATYNVAASIAGAVGALLSGLPEVLADWTGWSLRSSQRMGFGLYALAGVVLLVSYVRLPETGEVTPAVASRWRRWRGAEPDGAEVVGTPPATRALATSRRTVLELAALFSVDSAGGGMVVQSLLVLWLHLRHDLSPATTGAVFFAAGLLVGSSQFLAGILAARIGLVNTMVFTHLPANAFLVLAAFAPNGPTAVGLLLARAALSQMDVPARQALVMAVVPPEERAAAASVTNVPRSLAAAATPVVAGWMLSRSAFGWPLVVGGAAKAVYDVALLVLFRDVPIEPGARRRRRAARSRRTG